jgi:hypothetical protein
LRQIQRLDWQVVDMALDSCIFCDSKNFKVSVDEGLVLQFDPQK